MRERVRPGWASPAVCPPLCVLRASMFCVYSLCSFACPRVGQRARCPSMCWLAVCVTPETHLNRLGQLAEFEQAVCARTDQPRCGGLSSWACEGATMQCWIRANASHQHTVPRQSTWIHVQPRHFLFELASVDRTSPHTAAGNGASSRGWHKHPCNSTPSSAPETVCVRRGSPSVSKVTPQGTRSLFLHNTV